MEKKRICGCDREPDCQSAGSTIIKTATGLERASVDLETGEVRYTPVKDSNHCPGEHVLSAVMPSSGGATAAKNKNTPPLPDRNG